MSEAITVGWLEKTFGLAHEVHPYGACISIPPDRFLPKWEPQLKSQGYYVVRGKDAKQQSQILVTRQDPAEIAVEGPHDNDKAEEGDGRTGQFWSSEETSRLIQLYKEFRCRRKLIVEAFRKTCPDRSEGSILNQIGRLQQKGVIQPRWKIRRSKQKGQKKGMTDTAETASTEEKTSTSSPAEPEAESVTRLLREIRDLMKPQSICFSYACAECSTIGSAEDSKIWRFCPICGKPLIIWDVE
jgi:hypothetical protein